MMMSNRFYMHLMLNNKKPKHNKNVKDDNIMNESKKSNLNALKLSTKLSPKLEASRSPVHKVKEFDLLESILEIDEPEQEKPQWQGEGHRNSELFQFTTEEYEEEVVISESSSDSGSSDDESVDL